MKTIFKYELPTVPGEHFVDFPQRCNPLGAIRLQNGHPVMWALVDTDSPTRTARLFVAWTGKPCETLLDDPSWCYMDTLQIGGLVYHYFLHSVRLPKGEPVYAEKSAQPQPS